MKHIYLCLLLPLLFTGCGDSSADKAAQGGSASAPGHAVAPADPVSVVDGVTVVHMTGNDQMKYNLNEFTVPAGSEVKLTLHNVGKMPKAAMAHNVVILNLGEDPGAFVAAAASARENDYIPAELEGEILAATKLLGPGESDTIEFTAPSKPGDYDFFCSFPAHMFAGMRGVMTVE